MSTVASQIMAARTAARKLGAAADAARRGVLRRIAAALRSSAAAILEANARDLAAAGELPMALRQRLRLDEAKLAELAEGARALAEVADPLGQVRIRRTLDLGLELTRVTVPLGVLAVVFEARPDAVIQIGILALRTGNALLLKGGRESAQSTAALVALMQTALQGEGLPAEAIQVLAGREELTQLIRTEGAADLVVARGSKDMVRELKAQSRIPVLGHAEGLCHIYLDVAADPDMAQAIVLDAKLDYPAACNTVETLLVHEAAAPALLPGLAAVLRDRGVELRGCPASRELAPMDPASEADWSTEYGEAILSVKVVPHLDAALAHIARYGSGHTEAIVTEDPLAAGRFLAEVDAAGVFHNASTRFADGYRYGFGAEVGISTSKLHARGPVGLEGLLSTKDLLRGAGHCAGDYRGAGGRSFLHLDH